MLIVGGYNSSSVPVLRRQPPEAPSFTPAPSSTPAPHTPRVDEGASVEEVYGVAGVDEPV